MTWRLADSLKTLRSQINERWPDRVKASDGTIGDARHGTQTDHYPNGQGVVCAFDLTAQTIPIDEILDAIRESRDSRIKYVIYNRRIFRSYDKPGIAAWTWSAYTKDPHTSHAHISVGQGSDGKSTGNYDDPSPWALTPLVGPVPVPNLEDDMALDAKDEKFIDQTVAKLVKPDGFGSDLQAIAAAAAQGEIAKLWTDPDYVAAMKAAYPGLKG